MRIGVHLVKFDFDGGPGAIGPTVAAFGAAAEGAGLDNLSLMDHYLQLEFMGPPDGQMLEGYTTLGFLAAHTSTVDLQLLVTGVTYRHPGLLAKIVTTLDVLSEGRAVLGLGAAWYEQEHQALGVPFPPVAERFERLEETLQVVHRMFDGDRTPYEGKHYRLGGPVNSPAPVRRPPIMIGGGGTARPRAPTTTRSPRPSSGRDPSTPPMKGSSSTCVASRTSGSARSMSCTWATTPSGSCRTWGARSSPRSTTSEASGLDRRFGTTGHHVADRA